MINRKKILGGIAKRHLAIPTLKSRRSNSLDFHTVSVWSVAAALDAAVDAGKRSVDIQSLDVHAILAERRQIALIWGVEDLQEVRPDLSDEQAWQVLQNADRRHDATMGINWDTLECHAEMLFGDAPDSSDI